MLLNIQSLILIGCIFVACYKRVYRGMPIDVHFFGVAVSTRLDFLHVRRGLTKRRQFAPKLYAVKDTKTTLC